MAIGRKQTTVDARKPGSVEAALRRSLRAAVAGDWSAAETWLERIVQVDSTDLDAYHALARLYRSQGAIDRAIRMHQNVLLRRELGRKERAEALLELARDFDAGGFGERAAAGYEEVLDAQPRNREALRRLVVLLREQRAYDRALALVKRLRRLDREAADAAELETLVSLARSQMDEGDADAARSTLKRCLRRHKTSGLAWSMLGDLEAERGRDARAINAWRRALAAEFSMAETLLPKIEAGFAARGKASAYEDLLRSTLEAQPSASAPQIALARSLRSRGQTREAIEELSRAVERTPNGVALHVELGRQVLEAEEVGEIQKAYAGLLDALERGGQVVEESDA